MNTKNWSKMTEEWANELYSEHFNKIIGAYAVSQKKSFDSVYDLVCDGIQHILTKRLVMGMYYENKKHFISSVYSYIRSCGKGLSIHIRHNETLYPTIYLDSDDETTYFHPDWVEYNGKFTDILDNIEPIPEPDIISYDERRTLNNIIEILPQDVDDIIKFIDTLNPVQKQILIDRHIKGEQIKSLIIQNRIRQKTIRKLAIPLKTQYTNFLRKKEHKTDLSCSLESIKNTNAYYYPWLQSNYKNKNKKASIINNTVDKPTYPRRKQCKFAGLLEIDGRGLNWFIACHGVGKELTMRIYKKFNKRCYVEKINNDYIAFEWADKNWKYIYYKVQIISD